VRTLVTSGRSEDVGEGGGEFFRGVFCHVTSACRGVATGGAARELPRRAPHGRRERCPSTRRSPRHPHRRGSRSGASRAPAGRRVGGAGKLKSRARLAARPTRCSPIRRSEQTEPEADLTRARVVPRVLVVARQGGTDTERWPARPKRRSMEEITVRPTSRSSPGEASSCEGCRRRLWIILVEVARPSDGPRSESSRRI
jgi:hypothetical protein